MVLPFYDRKNELGSLEKLFRSDRFEMMVLYGRRRIGKTYMLKKFLDDKGGFYFLCDKAGTRNNTIRLKREFARHSGEPPIESDELDDIFRYIAGRTDNRMVLVLDEFSYLVERDPSIPSVLQRIIDEILLDSNILLVLCGSSISMMEEGALSSRSPLYGRRSAHIRLGPIPFVNLSDFFPKYCTEDLVRVHSVFGSVPYHLGILDGSKTVTGNIEDVIMNRHGKLFEETDFQLKQELRQPDVYKTILSSIAGGDTRIVDISDRTRIEKQDLPKYLIRLISLGLVKKEFSITDKKGSRPHYVVDDNLIDFWYRFCEPFKSDLEIGDLEAPMANLDANLNSYVGKKFEQLVRGQLIRYVLDYVPDRIGRFWKGEIEIDIVAVDRRVDRCTFIEVKWSKADPSRELGKLDGKIEMFPWKFRKVKRIIVAKELKAPCEDCIDLRTLMSILRR